MTKITLILMWYTKSAEQGRMATQYNLRLCYEEGEGVDKDLNKAIMWYSKAAQQGYEDAKKALLRLRK